MGSKRSYVVAVPHWFLVLLCAPLGVALHTKPRWRFRIADLLGAMTVWAVLLGLLAMLPRGG
jgi:hypothetical protein